MITACILAGGMGTRLGGVTKPALAIGGATILERQLAVLAPRVAEILVAIAPGGARMETSKQVRYIEDATPGAGPLAGLAAALAAATHPWVLVLAGDLPHLQGELLDLLIGSTDDEHDAVVPRVRGLPEPLLAMYSKKAAPHANARLAAGRGKTAALLDDLRVTWIDEPALRARDRDLRSFDDVDTPDDLERHRDH